MRLFKLLPHKQHQAACSLCLVFLLFCWKQNLAAQTGATVSARITAADKSVIDLASVALLLAKDSTFIRSAVPDQDGLVEFSGVQAGQYLLRVYLIGYQKQYSELFVVDDKQSNVRLPDVPLQESSQSLAELTIAAKRPFIERKLDRLIVNVDNSSINAGSSLLDVMERSPNVSVNQDNGINLRGKSGVIVMIDGRPTPLAGVDLISYLRSIPSANVDRIEIITNPSAKYDAAGNAGIIDIKFKKDKNEGLNGSLSLSYGQGFYAKPSASANLNFRNKKWNLFSNYSFGAPKGFTRFFINRKFFDADHELDAVFDQNSFIEQPIQAHFAKFGADYYCNKKTIVGIMFNSSLTDSDRDGHTLSVITNPEGDLQYTTQNNNLLESRNFNGFANANLKHDFNGEGTELSVDLDYGTYTADNFQVFNSAYFDALGLPTFSSMLETEQAGKINVYSAKADFVSPLDKKSKLEAGLKSSFVNTDNDILFYDVLHQERILDTLRSNHFIYDENVNAAYLNFTREMKKVDIQLGLRLEQTITNGRQITTGETFSRKYAKWFPSVLFNRKVSKNYQVALSYNRRIDRPSYRQLNPFRIFVDPYTYVVGDPELKPVLTDNLEVSHTILGRYVATLGYSRSKEVITDIFVQDDSTKISNQIPANLQQFDYVIFGFSAPFSVGKWLNSNLSGEAYWGKYSSPLQGGQLLNEDFTWNAKWINAFSWGKKGWSAELNVVYRAQEPWGLFVIRDLAHVSIGLQKVSADKNSTFKLGLSDLFYTNRIAVIVQYQNMDFYTNRTWDGRVITASFTHRFGKKTVAQARRRSSGVEDEKRRAN